MENINTPLSPKKLESLYLDAKYDQVIDQIIKAKPDYDIGGFHYNLGTVYAKSGQIGIGRYHLELALKNGYINTSSINNLKYVKSLVATQEIGNTKSHYDQLIDFTLQVPFAGHLALTLLGVMILLFLLRLKVLINKWILLTGFVVALIPVLFYWSMLSGVDYAVCLKNAPVREGPSKLYDEVNSIGEGTKIIVGRMNNGWYLIKSPSDVVGWINKSELGLIK